MDLAQRNLSFVSLVSFVLIALAAPARAELVFFADGRNMSVRSHRADGGSLVLALRSGGEIVCDAALVARIEPDEIPYPEEEIRSASGIRLQPDSDGLPPDSIQVQPDS